MTNTSLTETQLAACDPIEKDCFAFRSSKGQTLGLFKGIYSAEGKVTILRPLCGEKEQVLNTIQVGCLVNRIDAADGRSSNYRVNWVERAYGWSDIPDHFEFWLTLESSLPE